MAELDPRQPHYLTYAYVEEDGAETTVEFFADDAGVVKITEEALRGLMTIAGFELRGEKLV